MGLITQSLKLFGNTIQIKIILGIRMSCKDRWTDGKSLESAIIRAIKVFLSRLSNRYCLFVMDIIRLRAMNSNLRGFYPPVSWIFIEIPFLNRTLIYNWFKSFSWLGSSIHSIATALEVSSNTPYHCNLRHIDYILNFAWNCNPVCSRLLVSWQFC